MKIAQDFLSRKCGQIYKTNSYILINYIKELVNNKELTEEYILNKIIYKYIK